MSYQKINKPSATAYLNTNTVGKQQYDEASLTYDDAATFYDGINQGAYNKIGKPVSTTYTNIAKPI